MTPEWSWRLGALLGGAILGSILTPALPAILRAVGLERRNYQGGPIGTGAGLLFVLGSLPWLWIASPGHQRLVAAAAVGFGALGFVDDRWGTAEFKGLRGHLGALWKGRLTTGLLKAVGGLTVAAALAWMLYADWRAIPAAALIALTANLLNLLDLRPLRTLKAFWLFSVGLLGVAPPVLWAYVGLSVPYARLEAKRRVMLGDAGANLLGGVLGCLAAVVLPPLAQASLVLLLAAFHAWAERHSLTAWIAAHAWARAIDEWGRQPETEQVRST
jgi:UDP-N-acetylmuramyl pentapeptide phosphotransferase/UDP-N-acetylglucosamine-1-phosphate transferase